MECLLTRLDEKMLSLKKRSKKALVAYLVAGDPDLDSNLEQLDLELDLNLDLDLDLESELYLDLDLD